MKRKFLLIPILLLFSCAKSTPKVVVDGGTCPICVTDHECPTIPPQCTTQNIEACVEKCWSENNCFFTFGPKSCLKKCSKGCLSSFGCKWAN